MRNKDFSKILKEEQPQKIIGLHTHHKIFLTNKQIDEVIKKRDMNGVKQCPKTKQEFL